MALFGKKPATPPPSNPLERLSDELKQLIQKAQEERSKLSSAVGRTKGSVEKLERLEEPLAAAVGRSEDVSQKLRLLEDRVRTLDSVAERLEQLTQRAANAEQGHSALEARLTRANHDVADVMAIADGLKESVAAATQIRTELQAAMSPGGNVAEIRAKLDDLRGQFLSYSHDVDHVRTQDENLKRTQEEVLGRVNQAREEALRVKDQLDDAGGKLAHYEVALANLAKVQELAPRAEQDVQALNALADHVGHKTRILEKQREVVDRAAAQAARLDDIVWDLDARLKKLQQDSSRIKKTQDALEDLQELVRRIEARTIEVRTAQQATEKEGASQVARLTGMKDEIKANLDRFDIEKRGLDAVNQRIADLRGALTDFERRVNELQGTGQGIAHAQARADELAARLSTVASDVMRVSEQAERARAVEATLERTETASTRLTARVESLQASFPDLQQLQRDLAELKGTRETVLDTLDRLRAARNEVERAHATQTEARAFAATVDQTVNELRQKMTALDERSGMVERVAQFAESALAAQRDLEARREFMEQLERRVAQLGVASTELEQRARIVEERRANFADFEARAEALRGRLDDADKRFGSVATRVGETEEVEARITEVAARAESAQERMATLARGMEDVVQREAKMRELAERTDRIGRELEQRERTLEQAAANLERASAARQAAMEAAQSLEEQGRKLSVSIAGAEAQGDRVAQLTEQLEARAGGLRLVEKRLTAFEEKLAQMERAEQQIERSMEGLSNRAKSVDAVRDELTRIFELVEHTMADVRAITTARQEVHTTRGALEELLHRATQVDQLAAGIDRRQREIELAEQRIARLDALVVDVRASLESLQSQKATIDHVLDKASQLTFLAKEAEALIVTLREERDLTSRVHEGLKELRDEERGAQAG